MKMKLMRNHEASLVDSVCKGLKVRENATIAVFLSNSFWFEVVFKWCCASRKGEETKGKSRFGLRDVFDITHDQQ